MTPSNADELELAMVRRATAGEASAIRWIYDRHARFVAAVAGRYVANDEDAKDVVQEALVRILTSLGSFYYRGPGSLRRWMARIAVNEALKYLKAASRLSFTDLDIIAETAGAEDDPPPDELSADTVYEQIRRLPDGYRTVFNLYVVEGMSHREIAAELGISEGTSASQLHRAKALLASRLKSLQTPKTITINEPSPRRRQMA